MMNPVSAMRLLTITLMAGTTAFGQTTLVESGTKAQWKFLDNGSDGGQPDRRRSITGNAAYAHRLRHEDTRRSDQAAGELLVFMSMEEPKVQRYLNFRKQPKFIPDQRVWEN